MDASRARRSGGSGLGLAIVQAIAEAHGGSVAVASVEGEGAAFTIVLPIAGQSGGNSSGHGSGFSLTFSTYAYSCVAPCGVTSRLIGWAG